MDGTLHPLQAGSVYCVPEVISHSQSAASTVVRIVICCRESKPFLFTEPANDPVGLPSAATVSLVT